MLISPLTHKIRKVCAGLTQVRRAADPARKNTMTIKRSILTSILLAFLGLFSLWLSAKWLGDYDFKTPYGPLAYLIPLVFAALMVTALRHWKRLSWTGQGKKALRYGYYIPLSAFIFFAISFFTAPRNQSPQLVETICLLSSCLLTGLFEEVLCRGLIQNILEEGFTAQGKSQLKAIVISSLIFSVLHFANLIEKPYFIVGTIGQVVYTFALGMMLGIVYAKTHSLVSVILLHAIFNFLGFGIDLFVKTTGPAPAVDASLFSILVQWVIVLPGIFFAVHAYRKDLRAKPPATMVNTAGPDLLES